MISPVSSIFARLRRARVRRFWLRDPERVLTELRSGLDANMDAPSLSLLAWLELTTGKDPELAEHAARRAIALDPSSRFAAATLAEVLKRRSELDAAVEVLRRARAANPEIPWYDVTLADALIDAKRYDEAAWVLEEAAEKPELARHALKRLARISLERVDLEAALKWQQALVDLAPNYLVYASDYVVLASLLTDVGRADEAEEVLAHGRKIYPRNEEIAEAIGGVVKPAKPSVGANRTPVRTPLITSSSDLSAVIDAATTGVRRPGDTIALSESPAAASQGRVIPLELIQPRRLAKLLCRYVGSLGPLHSPAGMQGAILDVGGPRIVAGAFAGAIGRIFGRRGWFYRVAGRSTAMIDDVAACLPPLDHHVIFGPAHPDQLAASLAEKLGCGVAIVDANHLTGAWTVGASPGVDRGWVEQMLADNPAGNEDEQTPVVVIHPTR